MSNKELDNLFKSKLEKINKKPGSDAWNKISTQIESDEGKGFPFMKIAAAILLLITFSFAIKYAVDSTSNITSPTIADNTKNTETKKEQSNAITESETETNTDESEELAAAKNVEEGQKQNQDTGAATNKVLKNSTAKEKVEKSTEGEKIDTNSSPVLIESIDKNETITQLTEENNLPEATIETQVASNNQQPETKRDNSTQKGKTIELDLSDFEKTAVAQNKPGEAKKDSAKGFKKILNIMDEVGIGDLRKAKNELFALNSKKDRNANSK